MLVLLIISAIVIIVPLAFYAGAILYKLRAQNREKSKRQRLRINNILQSIQTIALAMEQQQCNLSEGCIRLYHLLETLPLVNRPDFSHNYQGIYTLYEQVKELPTHQARKQLSSAQRKQQDLQREEKEAELESQILSEVAQLKSFTV